MHTLSWATSVFCLQVHLYPPWIDGKLVVLPFRSKQSNNATKVETKYDHLESHIKTNTHTHIQICNMVSKSGCNDQFVDHPDSGSEKNLASKHPKLVRSVIYRNIWCNMVPCKLVFAAHVYNLLMRTGRPKHILSHKLAASQILLFASVEPLNLLHFRECYIEGWIFVLQS